MVQSMRSPPESFVRDVVVSTLVLAGLYGLAQGVQFAPLQIPGYLLVVGFDVLEGVFGSAGSYYYLLFAAYVLGLGVVGGAVATVARGRSRDVAAWRVGVAGAVGVVGALSLLYGAILLVATSQLVPVGITGGVGLAMLAVAAWLAGVVGAKSGSPEQ
jgi:hypothetical protein